MSDSKNPPLPQEEMAAILLRSLPHLLSLAHKDERFRDIIAVGCAKQMPELLKKNGLDMNMVKEMKAHLDEMAKDGCGRRFLTKKCSQGNLSFYTLRIKLFRAMEYLKSYDEDCEKYRDLTDRLVLQNMEEKGEDGKPLGIDLVFVRDLNNPSLVAKKIEREHDEVRQSVNWRKALIDFMDNGKAGTAVHLTELELSDDDVLAVHQIFEDAPEFEVLLVSNKEIKIGKKEESV